MTIFMLTCNICGDPFKSGRPGATDCGNQRRHDELSLARRRADKKDDGKKGGKR